MFFVGVLVGGIAVLGLLFLAVTFGDRVHPRVRSTMSRMLLARQSPDDSTADRVIHDLREQDPDLAQVVESEPAVPVSSVPDALTAEEQRTIEAAPTLAAAQEAASRFIPNPDLREAVVALIHWRTRRNNSESQYQNSFRVFASRNGYAGRIAEKERIPWAGGGGSRIAVPDLILGNRVLVELKAGLATSSDTDRAMGQMLRYLLAWKGSGPAVLAICGDVSPEIRWLVFTYVRAWRNELNLPVTVFFKQDNVTSVDQHDAPMPLDAPKVEFAEVSV